ncbi:uncharacterized protein LOC126971120 isoform X2 [Leptidea sinapis]|uniref:uncharacterized protein LOC126971120 isoform X2 n=1 Tax=Leptidea sinapis TaxID=189913 RepID=UPI0021C4464F|nr:uncharacterized protein LOC126971120 isoform X2 [Leptidea sinapis]
MYYPTPTSSIIEFDEYMYDVNDVNHPTPWTMQPLVYYAQVPNRRSKRSKERRKQTPNCFVKAFRWYTQEREIFGKCENNADDASDTDFAKWLDIKYREFEDTQGHLNASSHAVVDSSNNRRCRRCINNNYKGDVGLRNTKSCEFIMHPKRSQYETVSECTQRGQSLSNNNNDQVIRKPKIKSRSATNMLMEKEICVIKLSDSWSREIDTDVQPYTKNKVCDERCPSRKKLATKDLQDDKPKRADVSCGCTKPFNTKKMNSPRECGCHHQNKAIISEDMTQASTVQQVSKKVPEDKEWKLCKYLDNKPLTSPLIFAKTSNGPINIVSKKDPEEVRLKPCKCSEHNPSATSSTFSQTSDCAINIVHTPLLMKIIHPEN